MYALEVTSTKVPTFKPKNENENKGKTIVFKVSKTRTKTRRQLQFTLLPFTKGAETKIRMLMPDNRSDLGPGITW